MFSFSKQGKNDTSGLPPRRTLSVEVIKADNVLACNKTVSDPYLTVALADIGGREIKTESFRTKQKQGTVNPVWNEKFEFGKFFIAYVVLC